MDANANADAGGSTIALRKLCSGELKRMVVKCMYGCVRKYSLVIYRKNIYTIKEMNWLFLSLPLLEIYPCTIPESCLMLGKQKLLISINTNYFQLGQSKTHICLFLLSLSVSEKNCLMPCAT